MRLLPAILICTLFFAFFCSKGQTDSTTIISDTLKKSPLNVVIHDSILSPTSDSLILNAKNIRYEDSTSTTLSTSDSLIATVTSPSIDSTLIDSIMNLKQPSIKTTPPLLLDTLKSDSIQSQKENNTVQAINDTIVLKNNSKPTFIDSSKTVLDTNTTSNTDTIQPNLSSLKPASTDSVQLIIDSTKIDVSLVTSPKDTIPADSLISLSIDTSPSNTLTVSSIDTTNQIDPLSLIPADSLISDTIKTNKPSTPDSSPLTKDTLLNLNDSATVELKTDTVKPLSIPDEQITGDPIIDSIMNASVAEMEAHKKSSKIINTKTPKKFSLEDLPEEISFVVYAYDSVTKEPIKANITMITMDRDKRKHGSGICNSQGYFSFFLTPRSHFELTVSYPDYVPIVVEMDLKQAPIFNPILKKNYPLKRFEVGDVIRLENINFKQGDFHLQREAFPVLDKLSKMMTENPKMVIKLKGHTDNTGSPNANIKLSNDRITEVRYYLLRKGIKLNRLKGEGCGGGQPLVPNNSPENMQINRRVEFEVLKI